MFQCANIYHLYDIFSLAYKLNKISLNIFNQLTPNYEEVNELIILRGQQLHTTLPE